MGTKIRRAICALPLAGLLCLLLLTSCESGQNFEAGQSLSPEELASLSAELFTTAPEPDTADGFASREIVYWTEGGSVYHLDRDCYHLKRAERVIEGSVKHAWSEGKERVCATCGEKKPSS